jgi:hypothetical protein
MRKGYELWTKAASVLLVAIMLSSMIHIPVYAIPRFAIFNIQKDGHDLSANVRIDNSQYFATAYLNGTRITLTGVYNASGIPQTSMQCLAMVPIPDGQPLRIPQCGSGDPWWEWWRQYCNGNAAPPCQYSNSYVEWGGVCTTTPYDGSNCDPIAHIFLDNQTVIAGEYKLGILAAFVGIISGIADPPLGVVAGGFVAILSLGFKYMYDLDKNPDQSMEFWLPYDPINVNYALTAPLFLGSMYVATPHWWWQMFADTAPSNVQRR